MSEPRRESGAGSPGQRDGLVASAPFRRDFRHFSALVAVLMALGVAGSTWLGSPVVLALGLLIAAPFAYLAFGVGTLARDIRRFDPASSDPTMLRRAHEVLSKRGYCDAAEAAARLLDSSGR